MDSEQLAREEIIELAKFLVTNSKKEINYFSGKPIRPFKWRFGQDNQSLCLIGGQLVMIDILISHFPEDESYSYSLWEHRQGHVDGNISEMDRIDTGNGGYGVSGYSKAGLTHSGVKMDFKEMLKDIEKDIEDIEKVAQDNEVETMDESIITIEHDVRVGGYILEKGDKIRILGEEEKKMPPWLKDKNKDEKDEKDEKKDSEKKKE